MKTTRSQRGSCTSTTIRRAHFALAIGGACILAGCAGPKEISEKRPVFHPVPAGMGMLAAAETDIAKALKEDRRDPGDALDDYLAAAQTAEQQLHHDPQDASAKRDYNFAVGRIIEVIRHAKLTPWAKPLPVSGEHGDFELVDKPDPRPEWNPALFEFTPADQFDVHGKYVTGRTTRDGIGAPAVAVEREAKQEGRREDFAPSQIFRCITVVAHFEGNRCILSFEDPLDKETVVLDGHTFPLAADFTVPLAVMLQSTDPNKHALSQLLDPEKFAHTARIERLQPYNPNKTIVLVIHGLMSSQATWTQMINTLRGDPVVRQHYQFWFYSYPSGYPYPYSAAILRRELDALEKRYPGRKRMVLIGHSMGGCISRLLITDGGQQLWNKIFGRPPEQVQLSPQIKEEFQQALIFRQRPEVKRVIFIAAPLKGSDMATSWLGRIGASLVRSPKGYRQASEEYRRAINEEEHDLKLKRIPNSVDTLAPNSRLVQAVNTIPIASGIPYHTIIGDRGKGDSPNSSDGIVPYWSSHMDGAKSERIVPSGHGAHQDPQAIQEVLRILKLTAD